MNRTLTYIIQPEDNAVKIKYFLRRQGYSNQLLAHLKNDPDSILFNNSPKYMNERLAAGDRLVVHIRENKVSENILPVALPLDILYEDEDIIAVNKPAGMPTHPSITIMTILWLMLWPSISGAETKPLFFDAQTGWTGILPVSRSYPNTY